MDSLDIKDSVGSSDVEVIEIPKSNDVLLGRGAACLRHPGNQLFREIIDKALGSYEKTSSRAHKAEIIKIIYDSVILNQGRFLKQNKETKKWHSVEKNHVSEKIAHAIRDRRATLERSKNETFKVVDSNSSFNYVPRQNLLRDNSLYALTKNAALDMLITMADIRSRFTATIPSIQIMKDQKKRLH
jgi:hypothetical protein